MSVFFLSVFVRFFLSLSLFARSLALRSVIERMWMCFLWHFRSKKKMALVGSMRTPTSCLLKTREKNPNYKKHFVVNTCVTCTHFISVFEEEMLVAAGFTETEFLLMFDWLFPTDVTRRKSVRAFVCFSPLSRDSSPNRTQHQHHVNSIRFDSIRSM